MLRAMREWWDDWRWSRASLLCALRGHDAALWRVREDGNTWECPTCHCSREMVAVERVREIL